MELTAADLFSGGGGASLGLTQISEVSLLAAADKDELACKYYNRNLPITALNLDLTDDRAVEKFCFGYSIDREDIDLVIGCPPCQRFSSLHDTTETTEDGPKDVLLNAFVSFIIDTSPEVVVFENVPGILTRGNEEYVEDLKHYLRKAGYGFDLNVFSTADYGVPQNRKRAIGFGIKGINSDEISFPTPTHAPPEEAVENGKEPWVSVEDAIDDLPPLNPGDSHDDSEYNGHYARNHQSDTIDRIKKIPIDGGSRSALAEDEQLDCHQRLDDGGAQSSYGRMSWEGPGPTITTRCTTPSSGRFIHPEQHRGITPREAARLMSFPDWYDLPEKNVDATTLIGNAVPPRFIETLVSQFLDTHSNLIDPGS